MTLETDTADQIKAALDARRNRLAYDDGYHAATSICPRITHLEYGVVLSAFLGSCEATGVDPHAALREGRK